MHRQNESFTGLPFQITGGSQIAQGEGKYALSVSNPSACLFFGPSRAAGVNRVQDAVYCLCVSKKTTEISCNDRLWILPEQNMPGPTVCITGQGVKTAKSHAVGLEVLLEPGEYTLLLYPHRPVCSILGDGLSLTFEGGDVLEKTYAHFYWDTLIPSVIEQTDGREYPVSSGYVVSTLQPGEYAGTYPDVDHEFQCKGRLALPGICELSVVERMMNLQFRMMREDPIGLWRNPCAVQPNGVREYHVRRDSLDRKENAEMFLITGNVEILQTAWLYYAATKNKTWLRDHIEELEGAASLLEHLTDKNGKLWSDVYYEDQVIKDGMECMSAAMAARGLACLVELEGVLARGEQAKSYKRLSQLIAKTLVKPMPDGFWDLENKRFIDWIDRHGQVHDHIHLLANCLPVLFGYATRDQTDAVHALIREHFSELQRFPTFLSPCIADYTDSEIGSGGPYDLCAAGRYWCWDAAYWAAINRGDILLEQLMKVARQAETDGYRMGERYDMNHVYYQDHKNWHGAPYYYEYPCVFIWVLIHDYLGVSCGIDTDLVISPRLTGYGSVSLDVYSLAYQYTPGCFTIWNQGGQERSFRLDIGALSPAGKGNTPAVFTLAAGEKRSFSLT